MSYNWNRDVASNDWWRAHSKNPALHDTNNCEERIWQMKNSTVTLLLDQLRRESQKQKEDGDLKDGEYQEITELIGQIERAFTNG
jgi:hypothetical protein